MRALGVLTAFFLILILSYVISKGLGNPFAGLGSTGELSGKAKESLERAGGMRGFLEYLETLLRGGGLSLEYREPSSEVALPSTVSTLKAIIPSFALASLASLLWLTFVGFEVPKPLRALAFVPEYVYALLFSLASWYLLWPSPLPGSGPSKVLEYGIVVFLTEFPKNLHAVSDLIKNKRELDDMKLLWRAVGLKESAVRAKVLRALGGEVASALLTSLALCLERSVFVEPMIGYTGIGYVLFNSVVRADVPLAALSFVILGSLSLTFVYSSSIAERALGWER